MWRGDARAETVVVQVTVVLAQWWSEAVLLTAAVTLAVGEK